MPASSSTRRARERIRRCSCRSPRSSCARASCCARQRCSAGCSPPTPPGAARWPNSDGRSSDSNPETTFACIDAAADAAMAAATFQEAATSLQDFVGRVPGQIPALLKLVEVCVDGGLEQPDVPSAGTARVRPRRQGQDRARAVAPVAVLHREVPVAEHRQQAVRGRAGDAQALGRLGHRQRSLDLQDRRQLERVVDARDRVRRLVLHSRIVCSA